MNKKTNKKKDEFKLVLFSWILTRKPQKNKTQNEDEEEES